VKLPGKIYNPAVRSKAVHLELQVDTGAIYTGIPSSLLEKISLKPISTRRFKLADGKVERYPMGEAYVEVGEEGATSTIAFLAEASTAIGRNHLTTPKTASRSTTGELKPLELLLLHVS